MADSKKSAPNALVVVLLENRHSSVGLNLRSHDTAVYVGERMQGLAKQLLSEEYEVATLHMEHVYLRQKNALLGKQRAVFGYTVYELVDSSRMAANYHPGTAQHRHRSLSAPLQSAEQEATYGGGSGALMAKESRFLLIGWVKLSGRHARFATVVFRAVCSAEQIPNGLPESPHLRHYIYRTLISYAHNGTGIWEQDTDAGRPYQSAAASEPTWA
ncbi:hypothetical protein SYNPS1DRAFT_24866 [Syncephalis pseudoplumigaleata]|uniref:Uncharacterized protein n=1 Tax=Syncephalis pseudoplumigaleata TaxID=1712513 RepID=A0A4V1J0Y2_9FUNG|nr:hypothetical protein SYNPS1DRAFT_24866 [Syncephalis pseudoplumigaleata]|eukprot:RKP23149.1 hypothetical protein SYNPS1DRAFT_24866 [Syncephalis pseudoplumigaleata]